mgnify:CR=1 FL=1
MKLNKTQGDFLRGVIERWEAEEIITTDTANRLKTSYTVRPFEWKELAKYSFWIAVVCGVIAVGSVLADHFIMNFLEKLFLSSYGLASGVFAVLAALTYYWGWKRRQRLPYKIFSNETILFIGVVFTAVSIGYLGAAIDNGSGHFSLLLLLAALVYGFLGLRFSSSMVWVFALLSLGGWFGAETGYLTDWGHYFLGMNYPTRFAAFGAAILLCRFAVCGKRWFTDVDHATYVVGMLYLFISLWLLSIFGDTYSFARWYSMRQIELWYWNGLTLVVSAITAYIGLRRDDAVARGFGISFFLLGIYTLYFTLLWDVMHVALFFFVLAVSFWLLGRKAEKIWSLEFFARDARKVKEDMN